MGNIIFLIFLLWVVACLFSWYWQNILYKRLKAYHYDKWVELGEPDIFSVITNFNVSPVKRMKMMYRVLKFLFKGDVELDADERIRSVRKINVIILNILIGIFIGYICTAFLLDFLYPINQ